MSNLIFPKDGLISKESWDKLLEIEKQRIGQYCNMLTRQHVYEIFGPYVAPYDHPDIKDCHPKPSRQDYNFKILWILKNDEKLHDIVKEYGDFERFINNINELVGGHPQQRFGQIFCNYVFSDYRDYEPRTGTKEIMNYIFPDTRDPFFEESEDTYKRLMIR